jgi:hypothetical protein
MQKINLIIVFSFLANIHVKAQNISAQVIANGGKSINNTAGMLQYTIGQTIAPTVQNGIQILTQGFQQPEELAVTGISTTSWEGININVFPNPVQADVNISIEIEKNENESFQLQAIDMNGKILLQQALSMQNGHNATAIDVSQWVTGQYLIKIIKPNSNNIYTAKLIKL